MIEGQVRAYLDGELSAEERVHVEKHLDMALVDELRSVEKDVTARLSVLDATAPTEAALAAVHRRLAQEERRVVPVRFLSRAAAIALMTLGAGATGLLGSPVQDWILRGWERVAQLWQEESATEAVETLTQDSGPSGTEMQSAEGRLRVTLESVPAESQVRIRMVDTERGWAYAEAGSRFDSEPGVVRIDVLDRAGDVVVEVSRSIPSVTVTVNGVEYLRKIGESVTLLVDPDASTEEREWTFSGSPSGSGASGR